MAENPYLSPVANPYAPPQAAVDDVVAGTDAIVRLRQEHLLHEVRLKSVGTLYYLIAALMVLLSAMPVIAPMRAEYPTAVYVIILIVTGLLTGAVGYGFRKLRPWVRVAGGLMSVLGLLNIPVGTLINAYILWLLFSAKGRTVLGKDYAAVMAATPTLRYRRTLGDWVAIGVVVALLVTLIVLIAIG